jgi:hypothetical protein
MISIEGMNLNVDDWHGRPNAERAADRKLARL